MKSILFLLAFLISAITIAQDISFIHTSTTGNSQINVTIINHPSLNNNPSAVVVISHISNPGGGFPFLNEENTGVYYDTNINRWAIFNEDTSTMDVDMSFIVYVVVSGDGLVHTATAGNQGPSPSITLIDDPVLNNNPEANPIVTKNWKPFEVYDTFPYGLYYDTTANQWGIFTETGDAIPTNSSFNVLRQGDVTTTLRHQATNANTTTNATVINHPALNNNPNAKFVFSHLWGILGAGSDIFVDVELTEFYDSSDNRWKIITEDSSNLPIGLVFGIVITNDSILGTNDNLQEITLGAFPNPTTDFVTIRAFEEIDEITVYNLLGQKIIKLNVSTTETQIDLSTQPSGVYLAHVKSGTSVQTIKVIKY